MPNVLHSIDTTRPGGAEKMLLLLCHAMEAAEFCPLVCLRKEGWLAREVEKGENLVVIPQVRSLDFRWIR